MVVDDPHGQVTTAFAEGLGASVHRAGAGLLSPSPPTHPDQVVDRLAAAGPVIADLNLLFWKPWLALDPLGVLRAVSRRRPGTLFDWPGAISGDRATYSTPGRRDFFEATLTDAVVLRPQPTNFPDDLPYRIERFA
ncbi:MAG: hypothetical protein ACYDEY_16370 [Acidimicrobiales bacterium]